MNRLIKILSVIVLSLGLLGGWGEVDRAEAKGKRHKSSFFKKFQRKAKATCKKVRRATVRGVCKVQNKVIDGAVGAASKIRGKKAKKVWRTGHYKKGNRHHTRGHFTRVRRHKKGGSAGGPPPAPTSYAPEAPSAPPAMDSALPPLDPVMPAFKSKGKTKSKARAKGKARARKPAKKARRAKR